MVFLFAVSAIQFLAVAMCLRTYSRLQAKTIGAVEGMLTIVGILVSTMLIALPVLLEFASIAAFDSGRPVAWAGAERALWLMGVGAAGCLALSAARLYRQRNEDSAGFFSVGGNVLGVMLAGYFIFVVADQVVFFSSPSHDAGMVNWALVRESGEINDIHCESGLIVAKGLETESATYRCPRPVALVLGRFSGTPIVPWPSYTEGSSRDLVAFVKKLHKESRP